jgi:hypothetical protein
MSYRRPSRQVAKDAVSQTVSEPVFGPECWDGSRLRARIMHDDGDGAESVVSMGSGKEMIWPSSFPGTPNTGYDPETFPYRNSKAGNHALSPEQSHLDERVGIQVWGQESQRRTRK